MNVQLERLEALQAEYTAMKDQPKNEALLRQSVGLHKRLLASVTTSDGPEFQMASELYDLIHAFTQEIVDAMTTTRLKDRTVRRKAIRDENARRALMPTSRTHRKGNSSFRFERDEARRTLLGA